LDAALRRVSPRFADRIPLPWPSLLIHAGLLLLWVLLFAMAFSPNGVKAWSVGVAYVTYDTLLLLFVAWQTWELHRGLVAQRSEGVKTDAGDGLRAGSISPRASLCVLIASHNEAGALPLTLAALRAQTDAPERIVVVDDGSSDATAAWLSAEHGIAAPPLGQLSAAAANWPALHWLRLPHSGKARALNVALQAVSEELVLTVDGDTLLDSGALAAVRGAFAAEPALVAVTGVIVPVCGPGWRARVFQWFQTYEYIRNFLSRYAWMRMESLLLVSGAFAGYRRSALITVGGFDPDSMVEDYELTHRLCHYARNHDLHWVVRVLGDARARTDAPASLRAFLRQRRRWFGGFLQTQYRYRAMVGDRRYGWLGTLMLPVKAVDTLQPLYGLTAFFLLVFYVVTGRLGVLGAAASVIGIKLAIDLAFHLWSIYLYRKWVGGTERARLGEGLLAALAEPFTFQLLRHLGAAMGWVAFLTQRWHWGRQERVGIVTGSTSRTADSD
jgi:cellulose synthase/poly-beta-1,6-N-acetylglucosamine synthase-like glycosyltransferase